MALVGVLALVVYGLWLWGDPWEGVSAVGSGIGSDVVSPSTGDVLAARQKTPGDVSRQQVEAEKAPIPTAGSLVVKATYQVDGMPVPDLTVMVGPPGADYRVFCRRETTDSEGVVRFDKLPGGRIWVRSVRHDSLVRAEIELGGETEVAIVLPKGISVTGIVVDVHGVAVPGAQVILGPQGRADRDIEHVIDTDADGRFRLASCPKCFLGARAKGHAPSRLHILGLEVGASKEIRIELPGPGLATLPRGRSW